MYVFLFSRHRVSSGSNRSEIFPGTRTLSPQDRVHAYLPDDAERILRYYRRCLYFWNLQAFFFYSYLYSFRTGPGRSFKSAETCAALKSTESPLFAPYDGLIELNRSGVLRRRSTRCGVKLSGRLFRLSGVAHTQLR